MAAARQLAGEVVVADDIAGEFTERVVEAFLARPLPTFSLAVTAGANAAACYRHLADVGGRQIDWWQVDVYWTDDCCLPAEHPERHERQVHDALLDRVGAANATYPMRCDDGPDAYQLRVGDLGRFDVVHLCLGPDGSVAGLFPGSAALDAEPGRLVARSVDPSGRAPHDRLTLTVDGIRRARLALVTASGEACGDALARVVAGDDLPASRVRADRVVWLVDHDAAGTLAL